MLGCVRQQQTGDGCVRWVQFRGGQWRSCMPRLLSSDPLHPRSVTRTSSPRAGSTGRNRGHTQRRFSEGDRNGEWEPSQAKDDTLTPGHACPTPCVPRKQRSPVLLCKRLESGSPKQDTTLARWMRVVWKELALSQVKYTLKEVTCVAYKGMNHFNEW